MPFKMLFAYIEALRELCALNSTSWRSRLLAAGIRIARIKELRWGSPATVRSVVDNRAPVTVGACLNRPDIVVKETVLHPDLINCPLFEFSPATGIHKWTVLYLHGGAYVHQAGPPHWQVVKRLVLEFDCRIIFPVYPKGPSYTFEDAYKHLIPLAADLGKEFGNRFVIMGDSAGAGLAVGLTVILRDEGFAQPSQLILYSPWLDLSLSNPSLIEQNKQDPWLNLDGLKEAASMWVGNDLSKLTDPRVSPINASLENLPPISMFYGTRELFYPDQQLFAKKLAQHSFQKGRIREGIGMIHNFAIEDLAEATVVWEDIAELLQ